jgi:Na+/H+ antiporter NhaC
LNKFASNPFLEKFPQNIEIFIFKEVFKKKYYQIFLVFIIAFLVWAVSGSASQTKPTRDFEQFVQPQKSPTFLASTSKITSIIKYSK